MKKTLGFIVVLGLLLASCSSDSNSQDPDNNDMNTTITYEGNIQNIMSANCLGCHGDPPTNNAPMSLTTYSDVRGAVESRNLIGRINSTNNPMPPSGRMPSNVRQTIEDWVDAGMPQN